MRTTKRLRSVAHSIAHHAMSGVCFVHPHLGEARKRIGVKEAAVNLLQAEMSLRIEPVPQEIATSTAELRERFARLMAAERVGREHIVAAAITFLYRGTCAWPDACYVFIETASGKCVDDAVGQDGRRAQSLGANKRLRSRRGGAS